MNKNFKIGQRFYSIVFKLIISYYKNFLSDLLCMKKSYSFFCKTFYFMILQVIIEIHDVPFILNNFVCL